MLELQKNLKKNWLPYLGVSFVALCFYLMIAFKSDPPKKEIFVKPVAKIETHKILSPIVEDLKPLPVQVAHTKKIKKVKKAIAKPVVKPVEENSDIEDVMPWLDETLEGDEYVAVNYIEEPVQQIVDLSIEENLPQVLAVNFYEAEEKPTPIIREVVSDIKQNDYSDIAKHLTVLEKNFEALPQPENVLVAKSESKPEPTLTAKHVVKPAPTLVIPKPKPTPAPAPKLIPKPVAVAAPKLQPLVAAPQPLVNIALKKEIPESVGPLKEIDVAPKLAGMANDSLAKKIISTVSNALDSHPAAASVNTQVSKHYLDIAPSIEDWMQKKKGHWELHLESTANTKREFQNANYEFPENTFRIPTLQSNQAFQLIARFFIPDKSQPIAEVKYPETLTPATVSQSINFAITTEQFYAALKQNTKSVSTVPLYISVFEAVSGNRAAPSPVADAVVKVGGYAKSFVTKENGSIRFAKAPAQSSFVVQISRPGYHDTTRVISTDSETSYQSVYLVKKDTVKAMTENKFTSQAPSPQQEDKAVLFGLAMNSDTQVPKAGERVTLPSERVAPTFINVFPVDALATTASGLFGFFNIRPELIKTVARSSGLPYQILGLKKGEARYIEMGSHKMKPFFGQVLDSYNRPIKNARVQLAGESNLSVTSDELGNFKISGIDYPNGYPIVLTADARGFVTTQHTVIWRPESKTVRQKLFLRERRNVDEALANTKFGKSVLGRGTLVGGALAFPQAPANATQCLLIELFNAEDEKVSPEHGPYLLNRNPKFGDEPCVHASNAGFGFYNLNDGLYTLRFMNRSHVALVESGKVSVFVQTDL